MVMAQAGRRVDDPAATAPRFPLANVDRVRERIRGELTTRRATVLVSSAACGADLLALDEASALGLRRRIVLPFARARFRNTSVVDRPGDWGPLFDRIVDDVSARGDLIVVASESPSDDSAYLAASETIVREAVRLAGERREPAAALVVWDGQSRGAGDLTDAFRADAAAHGIAVYEVSTL